MARTFMMFVLLGFAAVGFTACDDGDDTDTGSTDTETESASDTSA